MQQPPHLDPSHVQVEGRSSLLRSERVMWLLLSAPARGQLTQTRGLVWWCLSFPRELSPLTPITRHIIYWVAYWSRTFKYYSQDFTSHLFHYTYSMYIFYSIFISVLLFFLLCSFVWFRYSVFIFLEYFSHSYCNILLNSFNFYEDILYKYYSIFLHFRLYIWFYFRCFEHIFIVFVHILFTFLSLFFCCFFFYFEFHFLLIYWYAHFSLVQTYLSIKPTCQ